MELVTVNKLSVSLLLQMTATIGQWHIGYKSIINYALTSSQLLKLSQVTLGQTSIGHVVNLASNDVQRFDLVSGINVLDAPMSYISLQKITTCFKLSMATRIALYEQL